jgi:hypothetical protein
MLWAQFQGQNVDPGIVLLGASIAAVICGSIPLGAGFFQKQPVLGVILGLLTAGVGFFLGCCGGLPAAMVSCAIIAFVAQLAPAAAAPTAASYAQEDEYDAYARPFQLPGSKYGETPSGMSDRERDRRHQQKYGFRPRPRRPDPPPESDF